ncbi:RILP-like protein 2 isoform X2 [Tupaia chinensis]|uniref:RILP-like protein 2 isoform X2 n=1 Tax=Tupaia chinensis TaxID=246437 RepID=UPI000FFB0777|nr:RILP-like protein 2 isoform X2 [Tupaia chinensis]
MKCCPVLESNKAVSAWRKVFGARRKFSLRRLRKRSSEAAGVWAAMEEPPLREEQEEEEEDDDERDEAGPEGALGKSPFQLTTEDVYDISYVMGRELMALGSDPRVTQLQFKIVRVLEMLEALVNEGSLTVEELRMERDNLRKEVEGLRREGPPANGEWPDSSKRRPRRKKGRRCCGSQGQQRRQ